MKIEDATTDGVTGRFCVATVTEIVGALPDEFKYKVWLPFEAFVDVVRLDSTLEDGLETKSILCVTFTHLIEISPFVFPQICVKFSFDPSQYTAKLLVLFDKQILDKLTATATAKVFVDKFLSSCVVFTFILVLLPSVQLLFVELQRMEEFDDVELTVKLMFEVGVSVGVEL